MKILFDTDQTAIQWIALGADGLVEDTSQDGMVDNMWRGGQVRDIAIGMPLQYNLPAMPEGEWWTFGGNVVSIHD